MNTELINLINELDDDSLVRVERLVHKLTAYHKKQAPVVEASSISKEKPPRIPKPTPKAKRRGDDPTPEKRKIHARMEPIDTSGQSRPNLFLDMQVAKSKNTDLHIDGKLAAGNQPTQRQPQIQKIEIQCSGGCDEWFTISSSQMFKDSEDNSIYICNNCSIKKGH